MRDTDPGNGRQPDPSGPPRSGRQRPAKAEGAGRSRSTPERSPKETSEHGPDLSTGKPQRLQKIWQHAGLGSRECEEYILQGRVTVDGKVVRELGTRVDSEQAAIAVDGETLHPKRWFTMR